MNSEALRLDRVTCIEQGLKELNHFCLSVNTGEIMGLIPVNETGLEKLTGLLVKNDPIHYGYIYYNGRLVNHWLKSNGKLNRIGLITGQNGLAGNLTVADNVFVLKRGFGQHVIRPDLLNRQLQPFLEEVSVRINPGEVAQNLTAFERYTVEIIKAVVAGCKLMILCDAGAIAGDSELGRLADMLRHYANNGYSFLYVSRHDEEIRRICQKAAVMMDGHVVKVLPAQDADADMIRNIGFANEALPARVKSLKIEDTIPALELSNIHFGTLKGITASFMRGECAVIQDPENRVFNDLIAVLRGQSRPGRGIIKVNGRRGTGTGRDITCIVPAAVRTMLFPELSYMDNLLFTMDHRLKRIWLQASARRGIREECEGWLGKDVFNKRIDELTTMQKYELVYTRVLLQRPQAVLCVQPFMQADVSLRARVRELMRMLLSRNIAVVILAVSLTDTRSLADVLWTVKNGRIEKMESFRPDKTVEINR